VKVTIDGQTYPFDLDLTFREDDIVRRVSGIGAGNIHSASNEGDSRWILAICAIAYIRAGKDPESLPDMKIRAVDVDFTDEAEGEADPPVVGAPEAPENVVQLGQGS
jgi:hypothetical protein